MLESVLPVISSRSFMVSCLIFKSAAAAAKSLQSCPTLCDPIDGSPLGSPIPGILQARTLEWVRYWLGVSKSEQGTIYVSTNQGNVQTRSQPNRAR